MDVRCVYELDVQCCVRGAKESLLCVREMFVLIKKIVVVLSEN